MLVTLGGQESVAGERFPDDQIGAAAWSVINIPG